MQDKTAEFCSQTERPPRSINRDFVLPAAKELGEAKAALTKAQEGTVARLAQVFGDTTALAISFRRQNDMASDFMTTTPDFDYEALDAVIDMCNKNKQVHERILHAVVQRGSLTRNRRRCRRKSGTRSWTGTTTSSRR